MLASAHGTWSLCLKWCNIVAICIAIFQVNGRCKWCLHFELSAMLMQSNAICQVASQSLCFEFSAMLRRQFWCNSTGCRLVFQFWCNLSGSYPVQMVPVFKFAGQPVRLCARARAPFETIGGGEKAGLQSFGRFV